MRPRSRSAIMARLFALLPCALLAACINTGDRNVAIPTQTFVAGDSPGDTLVVVLPGRWDNVEVLAGAGIVEAVQGAWPDADVLLTSATMAYYTDGRADPAIGRRAWLAYGAEDRLRDAVPVFAPLLPESQVIERPGGHTWEVWVPAAGEVLDRVREVPATTGIGSR